MVAALLAAILVGAGGQPAAPAGPDPAPVVHTVGEPWLSLAVCESGMDGAPRWRHRGLHHGGLQFRPSTWTAYAPDGFPDEAWQASPRQQVQVAERVQDAQGWGAWPSCSRQVELR